MRHSFTPLNSLMMISVCRFVHMNLMATFPFHSIPFDGKWSAYGASVACWYTLINWRFSWKNWRFSGWFFDLFFSMLFQNHDYVPKLVLWIVWEPAGGWSDTRSITGGYISLIPRNCPTLVLTIDRKHSNKNSYKLSLTLWYTLMKNASSGGVFELEEVVFLVPRIFKKLKPEVSNRIKEPHKPSLLLLSEEECAYLVHQKLEMASSEYAWFFIHVLNAQKWAFKT